MSHTDTGAPLHPWRKRALDELAARAARRREQIIHSAVEAVIESDTWQAFRIQPSYAPTPPMVILEATPET